MRYTLAEHIRFDIYLASCRYYITAVATSEPVRVMSTHSAWSML